MQAANEIVAETLAALWKKIEPGLPTRELDHLARRLILAGGAEPAFLGYRGFPAAVCISINEEIVHGIPGSRRLREGDIVSIDCGTVYQGFVGDAAMTFPVGRISPEAQRLLRVTRASLHEGLKKAVVGNRLFDISHAVQSLVENAGFSVVRTFVGHGVGRKMHEEPQVPNYGDPGKGPHLKPGMTLAVEPMVNVGTHEVEVLDDGWTAVTKDRKLSAHFEHSIAITENGTLILSGALDDIDLGIS
jgi:methionyl aminopeptidase